LFRNRFYLSFPSAQAGAIAGGVVGGIAVIAAVAAALMFRRRKKSLPDKIISTHVVPFDSFNSFDGNAPPSPPSHPNTMANASTSSPLLSSTPYTGRASRFGARQQQNSTPPSSADLLIQGRSTNARDAPGRPSTSSSQGDDSHVDGALLWRSGPSSEAAASSSSQLTDEQATYVQTLYSLNVPAPAIALVVERMLREGGTPAPAAESSNPSVDIKHVHLSTTSPPRYEDTR
jgi:hypothetical protein